MKIYKSILFSILTVTGLFLTTGCEVESYAIEEVPFSPYVVSLGITSSGTTTYYVVMADDLMEGTINAVGKGIEQNGFHDYEQGNQTIFCVGGLGVTSAKAVTRNAAGYLQETGDFVFDNSLRAFTQITSNTMLGVEIPDNAESGDLITFYSVDIPSASITEKQTTSILPISVLEWPSITGLAYSEGKVYMTYFGMNPKDFETPYTDTTYVAVYDYPEMTLNTLIKDTRTGPAGSWYAHNGIFQVENGDLYIMSNSSQANGYSQSTKNAGFLRIPKGTTAFDEYHFDFEARSGGLKPAHIQYIGNGLVFAEVSTVENQTSADRWTDRDLKCCIIDLNNQTITDIPEIPVHNGNGGRRFTAMVDKGYVYFPVTTSEGIFIYQIDPQTATAVRGAKISTTFVGGLFKLD